MIIRPATAHDLPSILAIEKHAYIDPWHSNHFLYELHENPFSTLLVAEEQNMIIGYVDYWKTFEIGQINNLTVIEPLRGKGIGKIMLEETIKRLKLAGCEAITLEVRVSNEAAIHLYKKFGFHLLLIKPKYYQNGEDAYFMELKL
jgi:ribosomal-protein-alanine N-acetyltransferase